MIHFERGDIYMYASGGEIGHEVWGNRPVIVLSPQHVIDKYNVVCIVPLSTTIRQGKEHAIIKSSKYTSVALCEQIKAVDVGRLTEYLGEITQEELEAIEQSIHAVTGIEKDNQQELRIQLDMYKKLYDDLLTRLCTQQREE